LLVTQKRLFQHYPPEAAIVADKTARSSARALPTRARNPEIMSLPASALAGEGFTHIRTLQQARSRSSRHRPASTRRTHYFVVTRRDL
jgi:hypothetical protein